MKNLLKQGRAAGMKLECDDCHSSEDDYSKLTDKAKERFKELLSAAKD